MNDKLLLFIPMYNCEKQIVRVLGQLKGEILDYIGEVIIVNNRSTDDGENAVCKFIDSSKFEFPISLLRNDDNYSLGGSHKVAFNYAKEKNFKYLVVLHGDDQGNINDLLPFLKNGQAYNYDAFLGSRFEKKSQLINYSKFRIIGNHIFNLFMTVMLRKHISDLGSGLNMYRVNFLDEKYYKRMPNNLTFNVYLLLYGIFAKARFKFFPLSWREDDQVSNAKFFKQSCEIANLTFRYVFNKKGVFNYSENEYSNIAYTYRLIKKNNI